MNLTLREWLKYKKLKLETFCALNFGKDRFGARMLFKLRIIKLKDSSNRELQKQRYLLQQRYQTDEVWNLGPIVTLFNEDND
jgi:hypothetical protein